MAKKMFDILPPKTVKKIEKEVKSLLGDDKKSKKARVDKKHTKELKEKRARRFPLREVLAGSGILLLVVLGVLYFKLQKADVDVWPKTEVLSFKEQVMADKTVDAIDSNSRTIPAQYFEEEKDLWQEFKATGNASNDGKAGGTIVVYNKYSPATPLSLKSGTHFLSDSGKYFVTLSKISVPAAKKVNGKIVPGSISVKVQAAEAGEAYNIKPAKFSVPKLSGTAYYYSIYAESEKDMTGGFESEVKKVTEEDIQNAKDAVTKVLQDSAIESLKSKISQEYVLLDNAILTEITESVSAVKAGAVVDKFNYSAKIRATALAFKKSDLESFVKQYIVSNILESETFLDNSVDISYSAKTVDIKDGKMVLNLEFSAKTYRDIDKDYLAGLFRDKSATKIKEIVNSELGEDVSNVEAKLWPFWTTKAPKDKSKIKVELKFE